MERVWDYPRPPALVPCERRVTVRCGEVLVAQTDAALRVLETSHPPTVYVPPGSLGPGIIEESTSVRSTWCEWKGSATYVDVLVDGEWVVAAGWTYRDPVPAYAALRDFVCFYPSRVRCWLDDEPVQAQEGDFYGGWITTDLVGPFKGGPGTLGW